MLNRQNLGLACVVLAAAALPFDPRRAALWAGLAGLASLLRACAAGGANIGDIVQGIGIKKAEP